MCPVHDWSTTASANGGVLSGIVLDGSTMNIPLIDDSFRELCAQVAAQLGKIGYKGADMPSGATVNLANATGWYCDVTGTTTITGFGTVDAGQVFALRFTATLTLTHNATTLILPGAANITTTGGDVAVLISLGAGAWRVISYNYANPGFGWRKETDGTISLYNGATRMLNITAAGDLKMKGDVTSDAAGV